MIRILVANDDGIEFEGISKLVEALSQAGEVYVFAPGQQRSASSHALTIGKAISLKPYSMANAKEAYEVGGTPADCVRLGMQILKEKGIGVDLVCTGINHGANLGTDTMYSGTVSAAAEGMFVGVPSMAVSVASHEAQYFEGACKLAVKLIPATLKTKGRRAVVNINTPNVPMEQIKGVKVARLGIVNYIDWYDKIGESGQEALYRYAGTLGEPTDLDMDKDTNLINQGYATVSMVRYDLNDYEALKEIDKWDISL